VKPAPKAARKIIAKKASAGLLREAVAVINPLDALREISSAWNTAKRIAAEEGTKRDQIASSERVDMARLQGQRELLMTYLTRSFDERAANFERLFETLDQTPDAQRMALVLGAIVDLAKSSPFKALASIDGVRGLMKGDSEIEL
jgi:hypothetical protein